MVTRGDRHSQKYIQNIVNPQKTTGISPLTVNDLVIEGGSKAAGLEFINSCVVTQYKVNLNGKEGQI